MCGLGVLPATVCQYESKSVTQRKAEWSRAQGGRAESRACPMARPRSFRTSRAKESQLDKRLLSAEAGQQGLDDRRDEEDKNKVCCDAAGRIIFFDFGHGSSQRF